VITLTSAIEACSIHHYVSILYIVISLFIDLDRYCLPIGEFADYATEILNST
jgi:hypothetical protein